MFAHQVIVGLRQRLLAVQNLAEILVLIGVGLYYAVQLVLVLLERGHLLLEFGLVPLQLLALASQLVDFLFLLLAGLLLILQPFFGAVLLGLVVLQELAELNQVLLDGHVALADRVLLALEDLFLSGAGQVCKGGMFTS